jgi:hypothetical protein
MPDFHQPDEHDRAVAEATGAADEAATVPDVDLQQLRDRARAEGIADADQLDEGALRERLRTERPSSRNDPSAPDRPRT